MLENVNNGTGHCGNDEMVAYVFHELDSAGTKKFEKHLAACKSCSDEVAGFMSTRRSVAEWRNESFEKLSPLAVEIPFALSTTSRKNEDAEPMGWIGNLISQVRASAALQFGGSLVAASVVLLVGYFGFVSLASTTGRPAVAENSVRPVSEIASLRKVDENTSALSAKLKAPAGQPAESPNSLGSPGPRSVRNAVASSPRRELNGQVARVVIKKNGKGAQKRPTLTADTDDDDTSLRLSELFDQIGG